MYGPDSGLVRERMDALVRSVVDDPTDPFRVVEVTPTQVAKEPALIADEAAALAFGGGRRVVMMRNADDSTVKALKAFLDEPAGDGFVVVSAGDLTPKSKLRQAFERAGVGAALPCYRDDTASLQTVVSETLREHGLDVSREAARYLAEHLGADRMVTRRELEKLALYTGSGRVELDDAQACVGDNAALSLDDIAFACCEGKPAELERAFGRAVAEGANPVQILRTVARHVQRLHHVAAHGDADAAVESLRPPVFWKHKTRFKAQATAWDASALGRALGDLLEAEVRVKSTGYPQESVASRVLISIARRAPKPRRT
ncbi:DNA polymerase III subunit delta [Limimonas halophila]|uniref:DNA polymerase III subunit delta n=1 Tax=Limimonas halophila TaxID=1082479 RepID=UPI001C409790|nr:DNA polymerase III subunit delta [Limimonas halophila]